MERRRMLVALLASLALHALVAAWLLGRERPRANAARSPIEITLLTVPAERPTVALHPKPQPQVARSVPAEPPAPVPVRTTQQKIGPTPRPTEPRAREKIAQSAPDEPAPTAERAEAAQATPNTPRAPTHEGSGAAPTAPASPSAPRTSLARLQPPLPSTPHAPTQKLPAGAPPTLAQTQPRSPRAQTQDGRASTTSASAVSLQPPSRVHAQPTPLGAQRPPPEGHLPVAPPRPTGLPEHAPAHPPSASHRAQGGPHPIAQSNSSRGSSAGAPGTSAGADAPRASELSVAPRLSHDVHGTLIVNHGEDPEVAAAARVQAQREAEAQVRTWAAEDIGRVRVKTGGVDSYFAMMRRTLERNAESAPPFELTNNAVSEFLHAYQTGAARFGANGSVDSGESQDPELRNLERRLSGPPLSPGSRDEQIARGLGGTRVFLNEANQVGVGMVALIEIHQDRSGKLLGVRLVRTSGSKTFDRYALATIPKAVEQLQPPSLSARGTSPDGIHTLWAYRGEITYLRAAKTLTVKDIPYLLSAGALSALAGDFDLTTGQLDVADFRHPRYLCKVSLLAVY